MDAADWPCIFIYSFFIIQSLIRYSAADNGRFAHPDSWRQPQQSFAPASLPQEDQGLDKPAKLDSRRPKPEKPIETFTDLKQRPEYYDIVEPVAPHSFQRLHPASRPRQTFAPINANEEQPTRNRPSDQRRNRVPPNPDPQTTPATSDQGTPAQGQVPESQDGRIDRPFQSSFNAPSNNVEDRNFGNRKSVIPSERLRQPNTPVQRSEFRQPHHGPGFGYQFSTSHLQDVDPPPPRFSRLENPQLSPPIRAPPREQSFNSAGPPNVPSSSGLNFNVGSEVVQQLPRNRVPSQRGNRPVSRSQNARAFQENSRQGRPVTPSVVIEEKNGSPRPFDGTYQPLRNNPPTQRTNPPPQARAFGPQASPNLKTPASEALRSDLGATVSPAPIKHFGPPAATPLPSKFQEVSNSSEVVPTTPSRFAADVTTPNPNAGKWNESYRRSMLYHSIILMMFFMIFPKPEPGNRAPFFVCTIMA